MDLLNDEEKIFTMISSAGTAKSMVFEAMRESRRGNCDQASELLQSADEELKKAHSIQTELLQLEAAESGIANISLLMVHAQDHLMMSMLARDLADEIIELNRERHQFARNKA